MSNYDNTNSGASFSNDKKTSDTQPDYRGSINVDGEDYWISSWVKVSGPNSKEPGKQFLSHALTKKEPVAAKSLTVAPIVTGNTMEDTGKTFDKPAFKDVPKDDDIPF